MGKSQPVEQSTRGRQMKRHTDIIEALGGVGWGVQRDKALAPAAAAAPAAIGRRIHTVSRKDPTYAGCVDEEEMK